MATQQCPLSATGTLILVSKVSTTFTNLHDQEPTLFSGTIYENVAYGLASTSLSSKSDAEKMAMVVTACKSAFAHDFIEKLPQVS